MRGGLTTFATMAYIVAVNAGLLSHAGMPFESAGRVREVSPLLWGLGAVFVLRYVLLPVD